MTVNSRSYFLPVSLWLGGICAFAIVATMNAVFAAKYGTSEFERNVSIGGAVVIDASCLLLAAAFGMTLSMRRWLAAVVAFPFLVIVVAMSMGTAVGYFGIARLAPAEAARINAERQAAAAETVTKKLSEQADFWAAQVTAGKTADRKLFVEQSRENILTMLKVPTVSAEQAMPDPLSATISGMTGVSESRVQAAFLATLAAILVMLKVVLVSFGSYLWPKPLETKISNDSDDGDGDRVDRVLTEQAADISKESNVVAIADRPLRRTVRNSRGDRFDTVAAWLANHSGSRNDEYSALYDQYAEWCATHGHVRVDGRREFGRHLRRLGAKPYRSRPVSRWTDNQTMHYVLPNVGAAEAPELPLAA